MGFPAAVAALVALVGLCAAVAVSCSPALMHESFAGKSEFRTVNRKPLQSCLNPSPYLAINVSTGGPLPDEAFINVTVGGVRAPHRDDWVAMITPSNSSASRCPSNFVDYYQTGDFARLPLLCHYPVKAQFLRSDPHYLRCKNSACQKRRASGSCKVRTCAATITFHVINFRTDVEFVLFSGGFLTPCILKRSGALRFANPAMPLHGHLSSTDSTASSMRLTWVSGDGKPQQVQYGGNKSAASVVATFTQEDMCRAPVLPSPAKDFGWHDPGYIHSAVMTELQPSQNYTYRYGTKMHPRIPMEFPGLSCPPALRRDMCFFIVWTFILFVPSSLRRTPLTPSQTIPLAGASGTPSLGPPPSRCPTAGISPCWSRRDTESGIAPASRPRRRPSSRAGACGADVGADKPPRLWLLQLVPPEYVQRTTLMKCSFKCSYASDCCCSDEVSEFIFSDLAILGNASS